MMTLTDPHFVHRHCRDEEATLSLSKRVPPLRNRNAVLRCVLGVSTFR